MSATGDEQPSPHRRVTTTFWLNQIFDGFISGNDRLWALAHSGRRPARSAVAGVVPNQTLQARYLLIELPPVRGDRTFGCKPRADSQFSIAASGPVLPTLSLVPAAWKRRWRMIFRRTLMPFNRSVPFRSFSMSHAELPVHGLPPWRG